MGLGFNNKPQIIKHELRTNIYCELKIAPDVPKQSLFQRCSIFIRSPQGWAFHPAYEMFLLLDLLLRCLLFYLWPFLLCTCLAPNEDLKS